MWAVTWMAVIAHQLWPRRLRQRLQLHPLAGNELMRRLLEYERLMLGLFVMAALLFLGAGLYRLLERVYANGFAW